MAGQAKMTLSDDDDASTDIVALWGEALAEYARDTGSPLESLPRFSSVSDIVNDRQLKEHYFNTKRHDGGKIDKLRSAISRNSDLIQTGAQYLAEAATPAFPPSAAILTAFTWVMKAASDVSKDYDRIVQFFDEMNAFLERVSIIERKMPAVKVYKVCLMGVFSSLLKICGIARVYTEKGRFRKWFKTLYEGPDGSLKEAYDTMDSNLKRLESATSMVTLANTQDLLSDTKVLKSDSQAVKETTAGIATTSERVEAKLDAGFAAVSDFSQKMSQNIARMLDTQQAAAQSQAQKEPNKSKDPGARKNAAFAQVNRTFSTPQVDTSLQARDIAYSFVEGTCGWIFDEEAYKTWISDFENPVLSITGAAGMGKSFLAYSVVEKLKRTIGGNSRSSVAYFYFREEHEELRSLKNALGCVIVQAAAHDSVYCEQVAADLSRNGGNFNTATPEEHIWNRFFVSKYPRKSDGSLYLVLDGLDEAHEESTNIALRLLSLINTWSLNIRVLLTSRPHYKRAIEEVLKPENIDMSKAKVSQDIHKLIQARFKTFAKLRKFRVHTKWKITRRLRQRADGLLYIDHMMRRLNSIGREAAVLADIEQNRPYNLTSLYALMVGECQSRRSPEQFQSLKQLYAWLAFSKRPLTLEEANDLVRLIVTDGSLIIEEEIEGKSSRILEISKDMSEEGDDIIEQFENDDIQEEPEESLDHSEGDGKSPLRFQERSLREYFQAMDVDDQGLRTPPSAAHLTIFETAIKVMCDPNRKPDTTPAKSEDLSAPSLKKYVSNFWALHFLEVDINNASESDVIRVAESLRLVLDNTYNPSKMFERYTIGYSGMIGSDVESKNSFLGAIECWVEKAAKLEQGKLSDDTLQWLTRAVEAPGEVMIPLARGHVANLYWRQELEELDANCSFLFAREALLMTSLSPPLGEGAPNPREVAWVADFFEDLEKDATAHRGLGLMLGYYSLDSALKEYEESLKLCQTDSDLFYTKACIAPLHLYKGDPQKALDTINEALAIRPNTESEYIHVDGRFFTQTALIFRARSELSLEEYDKAVDSYQEARKAMPTELLPTYVLEECTCIFETTENPSGLFNMLETWTMWERLCWLFLTYDVNDRDARNARFQQFAREAGREQFVIQTYTEIVTWLDRTKSAAFARYRLAEAYRRLLNDPAKAKAVLYEILDGDNCIDPFLKEESISTLLEIRYDVANILYEEFRSSTSHGQKAEILNEMKNMPERRLGRSNYDVYDSQTSIILASMIRKMGPAHEFQEVMERTFQTCIAGLTDTEGWNDQSSLRLLAKLLAVTGNGLERDAQIAISLQFSDLDPGGLVMTGECVEDDVPIEEDSVADDEEDSDDDDEHDHDTGRNDEEDSEQDEKEPESAYPNEDLVRSSSTRCGGICNKKPYHSWAQGPLYTCLVCAELDLCKDCFQERRAPVSGLSSVCCGPDHKHVKGPIEGWKGVRGGFMRIGDGNIKFADWLGGLRDQRWKEAWERFWMAADDVKDVL